MTVYTISQNEMNQNAIALPPALVGYLSENDYVYICQRFRGVESEACCFALLVSMVLCLCITPIALLLCPCFVTCRVTSERKRSVERHFCYFYLLSMFQVIYTVL